MICLDTNYLIRGLILDSHEAKSLVRWYQAEEKIITSSIAWYEFLSGPTSQIQVQTMASFLTGGIISFDEVHALEAARLFNAVHRVRRLRVDAMIAATAIIEGAQFATANSADFRAFVPYGLQLVAG